MQGHSCLQMKRIQDGRAGRHDSANSCKYRIRLFSTYPLEHERMTITYLRVTEKSLRA